MYNFLMWQCQLYITLPPIQGCSEGRAFAPGARPTRGAKSGADGVPMRPKGSQGIPRGTKCVPKGTEGALRGTKGVSKGTEGVPRGTEGCQGTLSERQGDAMETFAAGVTKPSCATAPIKYLNTTIPFFRPILRANIGSSAINRRIDQNRFRMWSITMKLALTQKNLQIPNFIAVQILL